MRARGIVVLIALLAGCGEGEARPHPSDDERPALGQVRFPHVPTGARMRADGRGRAVPVTETAVIDLPVGPHAIHVFVGDESSPPSRGTLGLGATPTAWDTEVTVVAGQTIDLVPSEPPFGWPRQHVIHLSSTTPAHLRDGDGRDLGALPIDGEPTWAETLVVHPDDGTADFLWTVTSDWTRVRPGEPASEASPIVDEPDREALRGPLAAAAPSLRACAAGGADLEAVETHIVVSRRGAVEQVSIEDRDGTLPAAFATCALDALVSLRWDGWTASGRTELRYPIVLRP